MRILYLLFAVLVLLFQANQGYAQEFLADTLECKARGNFCILTACPPTFSVSGTCHGGFLKCCQK
ncbi:GLL10 protein, partial [Eudromia elegans]|nr:GLL10 protein [Eudromia elegans]